MLWLLSIGTETVIAEIDTLNFVQSDRIVKITQSGTTTTITLAHGDNTTDLALADVSARDVFRKIARQEAARRTTGAT